MTNDTLAIDIGGTKFTIGAFEGQRLTKRVSRPTDRSAGPSFIVACIRETVLEWRAAGFEAQSCGIGFGGPVDYPSQTVTLSTHVGGWAGFPLVDEIRTIVGVPIVMDNDANLGALGEAYLGAGRNLDPVFYMTLSTGIGGGIISRGKIYRGADSFAGEVGHTMIQPDGPACLCGSNGCFERLCCGLWLERDYGTTAEELMTDPDFVTKYVVLLARGLKTVLMVLNPAVLIIGGGIPKAGDRLFVPLRKELNRQMTSWSRARRNVVPAQLGDDSVLYGALVLANDRLLGREI